MANIFFNVADFVNDWQTGDEFIDERDVLAEFVHQLNEYVENEIMNGTDDSDAISDIVEDYIIDNAEKIDILVEQKIRDELEKKVRDFLDFAISWNR